MRNILNHYNETDRKYLEETISIMALFNIPCNVKTDEDFVKWCDEVLKDRDEELCEEIGE